MSNAYGAGAPDGGGGASWLSNLPLALQAQLGRVARYANPGSYATDPTASTLGPDAALTASDPDRAAAIAAASKALQSGAGNTNNPAILPYLAGPNAPNVQGRPMFPYGQVVTGQGYPAMSTTGGIANASTIPTGFAGGGGSSGGGGASGTIPTPPSGIGSDANFPVMGAGGFPTTYAPPGQQPPVPAPGAPAAPGSIANAPLPPRRPRNLGGGGARIPASATASVPPAAAANNPNFSTFQYQVPNQGIAPGAGSMGGQGSRAPIYTAANLGGLFGGGGANPANVPAANAQPVSGGVLSKAGTAGLSKAPWTYGPLQSKVGWGKKKYGPDAADVAAYHSGFA